MPIDYLRRIPFDWFRKYLTTNLVFFGLLASPLMVVYAQSNPSEKPEYIRYSAPEMFTYEELVSLSQDKPIEQKLAQKLHTLRATPFLSNEAYYRGVRPSNLEVDGLGKSMRVVLWNAERGVHLKEIILLFTDKERFLREAQADRIRAKKKKAKEQLEPGKEKIAVEEFPFDPKTLEEEVQLLQEADVIILNEVDWGMPRSDYEDVIVELGKALNTNWVWGLEFVEIDPVVLGTEKYKQIEDLEQREDLVEEVTEVDKERLRALHGTAILTRYPIKEAAVIPFVDQPYDWYREEIALRPLEKGIRLGSTFIGSEMHRELRRGGRTTVLATLAVPDVPEGYVTVVTPHLENRTKPEERRAQMRELLQLIQPIQNPVILAGDLNTTSGDAQSIRVEREIYKKLTTVDTYVVQGVKYATGIGMVYDATIFAFRFAKNKNDPTAQHIPFFSPNKEEALFNMMEGFRFQDGKAFDYRGDAQGSANGRTGTLANSNEREYKGFVCTYEWVYTLSNLGKHKLDWIFVKSHLEDPKDKDGSYRFAPHHGRTLRHINRAYSYFLSDHNPMTVDLPFNEPKSKKEK